MHIYKYILTSFFNLQRWSILSARFIKCKVEFDDDTVEGVERKMISLFPDIRQCGWRILRPITKHSTDLIPSMEQEPKNRQTIKR